MSGDVQQVTVSGAVQQVSVAAQGVQGVPGPAGGAQFDAIAVGSVNANTVVCAVAGGVSNPDITNPLDVLSIVGIATVAGSGGQTLTVMALGPLTVSGANFSLGPVYCGTGGVLTQTLPGVGAILQVGVATSSTTLQVAIQQPAIMQ